MKYEENLVKSLECRLPKDLRLLSSSYGFKGRSSMSFVKIPTRRDCYNFIAGQFCGSPTDSGVCSPWTGEVLGRTLSSSTKEVDEAVTAAMKAFPSWRQTPLKERSQLLFSFRDNVLNRLDEIANTVAAESGKTVSEGRAGVMKGLEVTEFALSLQNMDSGSSMDVSRGVACEYRREPLGVVLGIVPFNFPAMVPMWMYPIAVTLGNCFILKPSEKVPLTSQLMAECIRDAGFPAGVFQLVHGAQKTVENLIDHPGISAVGFVGSTPVARSVYSRATGLGKRALCLGGAKNFVLVAPDADERITVKGVVDSFTGCAGQRCMAGSLMIAVGDGKHLIPKIVAAASKIRLGHEMGAIIDKGAHERIVRSITQAEKEGAKILLDGRQTAAPKGYEAGNWIGPTIIDGVSPKASCVTTEIFGPVLTILSVATLSEAMKLEAANAYGNATSVFTSSGAVARLVADQATSSMIGVNIGVPVPREPFSFGGSKESKFGPCDITGESALEFWSQRKKITMKWSEQSDANWMS
jgi:malonate-semialdehyde dehydrogenase (acetylating)/methylmalonate-semialdehyde dehydrogenase